jgi:hypothetical protein
MDLVFHDPTDLPLPPNEVRIRDLHAETHPDGHRVRVYLELTPFIKRPNGELHLLNSLGEELASASIIEAFTPKMELTLHMHNGLLNAPFHLIATIYYQPEEGVEGDTSPGQLVRQVVDEQRISFDSASS